MSNQFVLHNPYSNDNGMEVFPADKAKAMLDRVIEIAGPLNDTGKKLASMLIDNRVEEVFKQEGALKAIMLSGVNHHSTNKTVHIYLASTGKV